MALFALKATRKLLSRLLASRSMGQLAVHADEINGRKRTNPHGGEYAPLRPARNPYFGLPYSKDPLPDFMGIAAEETAGIRLCVVIKRDVSDAGPKLPRWPREGLRRVRFRVKYAIWHKNI